MERFIITLVEEKRTEIEIHAKHAREAEQLLREDNMSRITDAKNGRVLYSSDEKHHTIKPVPKTKLNQKGMSGK